MSSHPVFVNRILNMKAIKWIGVDMDHTLIRYHTARFEGLVYQLVLDKLITEKNYPQGIKALEFEASEAIRGLAIDCKNGNILKLSRFGAIRHSFHGTKRIDFTEQKSIYRSVYVDLGDPGYMAIDTSFSLAFCVLYGQLVDWKDQCPESLPDYETLAHDLRYCVDATHADGQLKRQISQDLDQFVIKEKEVVEGLKRYRNYGKKFFILTNSDYEYTQTLLHYALDPFLEEGESWQDLFDYVITLAGKPRFFYDRLPFLAIDPKNGTMTNVKGELTPGIYQGGGAKQFAEHLQVGGDEILYIGDHIYGDILRLKKDCNWRTALVVDELGDEIAAQRKALPVERKIVDAMASKMALERRYVHAYSRHIEGGDQSQVTHLAELQQQLADIDSRLMTLLQEQQNFYNPKWERVFRAGAEESYFAYQVERFACIYMEKLSDLLSHSPITYFRSNRRLLAHDIDLFLAEESQASTDTTVSHPS